MYKQSREIAILGGSAHPELTEQVSQALAVHLGNVCLKVFPNSENYVRIDDNLQGKDVFVVQPHVATETASVNDAFVEHLLLIDAAKTSEASSITAVVPSLGYARQDKLAKPQESLGAAVVVRALEIAGADRIITIDPHSAASEKAATVPFITLSAQPLAREAIRANINVGDGLVVVAPDNGSVAEATQHAAELGCDFVYMRKERGKNDSMQLERDDYVEGVEGSTCLIFDDMIDTAGTLVTAAEILKESGASSVVVGATHAIFSDPALDRLRTDIVDELYVTNTHPTTKAKEVLGNKLHVLPIAKVLDDRICKLYSRGTQHEG